MPCRSYAIGSETIPGTPSGAQMPVTHLTSQGGPAAGPSPSRRRRPILRFTTRRVCLSSPKSRNPISCTSLEIPRRSSVTGIFLEEVSPPLNFPLPRKRFHRPQERLSHLQKSPPALTANWNNRPPLPKPLLSFTSNKHSFARRSRRCLPARQPPLRNTSRSIMLPP